MASYEAFDLNQPVITTECANLMISASNDVALNIGGNINKTRENREEMDSKSLNDDKGAKHERKKMKLSMDQASLLEDVFQENTTPNQKQKLDLAKMLNVTPRQVEVWFQNRRARTKLKDKEGDVACLKIYCEALKEKNKRLQKELDDLRVLNNSYRSNLNPNPTILVVCPKCNNVRISPSLTSTTTLSTMNPPNCDIKCEQDIGTSSIWKPNYIKGE